MAMSEAQREVARQRMKAWRAKSKAAKEAAERADEPVIDTTTEIEHPEPKQEVVQEEPSVNDLLRQINELKDMQWKLMSQQMAGGQQGPSVGPNGITGTVDKYEMTEGIYPDPTERLGKEPKLQRFAFIMNYELEFNISESSYTTIDNVRMREPKFQLELIRVMLDEDTGEDSGGRYSIARLTLHEDPDTALVLARQNGIDVEAQDEHAFLNEMRYIRMRDWLLDCFYPPKVEVKSTRRQTVIEGRLVDYWEKNTEGSTGITKEQWDKTPKIKF